MARSLAEQVALLPAEEQAAALEGLDPEALLYDWGFWGRPEQHAPPGNWAIWLFMAGRGAGKTRAASEWVRDVVRRHPGRQLRIGLVARTAADVRDVLVQGDSGILAVSPPSEMPNYQGSLRKLTWPNGSSALCFTADEPDQLRGPQFDYAWADEAAAWRQLPDASGMTAWANLRVAARLGTNPQICVTTTPKKVQLMRELLKEAEEKPGRIVITRGRTKDNQGNLSEAYVEGIYGTFGGSRMARQELEGEMLDDAEGALFLEDTIEQFRSSVIPIGTPIKVVGVDPTVAERPGDEAGIVVCVASGERDLFRRQAWVLEDATIKGPPDVWANRVVQTARKWGAPVVAEVNQGGALVRSAINSIDPTIPVYEVHSKQGKQLRAEPIALAYDQGRVHHLGTLAHLETQMTQWIPGEGRSPDRIDALVHALTALLIKPPTGFGGGPMRAHSAARARISIPRGTAARGGRGYGGGIRLAGSGF